MNELQLAFDYETLPVRTIFDNSEIWFVGRDVAVALGHQNPERAIRKFVDDEDKGAVAKRKNATVPFSMLPTVRTRQIKAKKMWKTQKMKRTTKRPPKETHVGAKVFDCLRD